MMKCPVCNSEYTNLKSIEHINIPFEKKQLVYDIHKCPNCGCEFADPMLPPPDSWYNQDDEYYGWRWEFDCALNVIKEEKITENLLEVGCGEGIFLERLKDQCHAVGIDLNKNAIDKLKKKGIEGYALSVENYIKSADSMEFDCVVLFNLLEHLANPKEFIEYIGKTLKKDGILIISVPNTERRTRFLWKEIWDMPPHHLVRYSSNGIKKLLNDVDMQIIDMKCEDKNNMVELVFLIEEWIVKTLANKKINNRSLRNTIKWVLRILYLIPAIITYYLKLIVKSKKIKGRAGTTRFIAAKKK